ncbi:MULTISPECIES: hypothetical protein [unclassified Desulfurobacterium]|uniref:hypothetical protein n=1 Tax=Desulfurobacterium sp. TC5-1 TaxID=1158318 RepID=UPI0003B3BE2B|nr:hypothetical protein [Desulfurobacterium sp. TC5-1]
MKKIAALTVAILLLVTGIPQKSHAEENATGKTKTSFNLPGNQWRVGLDTIIAGRIERNDNGTPKYLFGISAGLGFAFRYYFTVKDELQAVHPYLEGGTTMVIYPYFGGGAEYDLPDGNDPTGESGVFSVGGGLYFFSKLFGANFVPLPVITISYSFK